MTGVSHRMWPILVVAVGILMVSPSQARDIGSEEPEGPSVLDAAPSATTSPRDGRLLPKTLMFTLKERMSIEGALREGGFNRDDADATTPRPRRRQPLYLSGLLYRGPSDWTIWINGRALHPGDTGDLFSVADVDSQAVTLAVDWGETTRLVRLEPHQTFVPAESGVVEGKRY